MIENIVNDNQFMYKLFFKYNAHLDFLKYTDDENLLNDEDLFPKSLLSKINHFGSFEKYLEILKLEQDLSIKLPDKFYNKKMKI